MECLLLTAALCSSLRVLPRPRLHVDKFTVAHALSSAYDGATTANFMRNCPRNSTCWEGDPVARQFVGRHPSDLRMVLVGASVVLAVSAIPNRKVRHFAQATLTINHVVAGTYNLR